MPAAVIAKSSCLVLSGNTNSTVSLISPPSPAARLSPPSNKLGKVSWPITNVCPVKLESTSDIERVPAIALMVIIVPSGNPESPPKSGTRVTESNGTLPEFSSLIVRLVTQPAFSHR